MGPDALAFAPDVEPHLTPRELQALRLICEGDCFKAVAGKMGISTGTAKQHAQHIYSKFGMKNRTQLVLFALRNGLLDGAELDPLKRAQHGPHPA